MASAPVNIIHTRQCEVAALGEATLVQSKRHEYTGCLYVSEPRRHAGVAAFKAFGPEGHPDTYTFELVGTGTDDAYDDAPAIL